MLNELPFEIADKSTEIKSNSWHDAVSYCESLGEGWRLPTREELRLMHGSCNFDGKYYWSSTEHDDSNYAWLQDMTNGQQHPYSKTGINTYVRAIRYRIAIRSLSFSNKKGDTKMAKSFKQKMMNYINELEKRGVIEVDEERSDFTSYNVTEGYTMTYKTSATSIDPDEVEIYCIFVDDYEGRVEFQNEMNVDVVIIDECDLALLANINIAVALPLDEDEPNELVDDDYDKRLEAIEKRLDAFKDLISKLDHQQTNNYIQLNTIEKTLESHESEIKFVNQRVELIEDKLHQICESADKVVKVMKKYGVC